jgi:hypothetical protein
MIEVAGAVLLWVPRKYVIGAALLGATMVGAVLTHWFIRGCHLAMTSVVGVSDRPAPVCTGPHRDGPSTPVGRL